MPILSSPTNWLVAKKLMCHCIIKLWALRVTALKEAAEAYTTLLSIRESKTQQVIRMANNKPKKYKFIKVGSLFLSCEHLT